MPRYLAWVEEYKRYGYYVEADNKDDALERAIDLSSDDVEPDVEGNAGGEAYYAEEIGDGDREAA